MNTACKHRSQARKMQGASSLLVIAVLVLLSGLSAHLLGLVSSVSSGYAMEAHLSRVEQAAHSGLEWGRYQMMQSSAPCTPSQNIALPGSLSSYTVTLACTPGGTDLGPPLSALQYRLTSTACNIPSGGRCPNNNANPGSDYIERTVTGMIDR